MKKQSASQSAFFNLRVVIGLFMVLASVLLVLMGFGVFPAQAQQNSNTTANSTGNPLVPALFDCSRIQELGIDMQENFRAGAIMVYCGEAAGGEESPASPFPPSIQNLIGPAALGTADVDLVTGTETSPKVTQSETFTAANPDNPLQIVVAYNDSRGSSSNNFSGASVSIDGGNTFTRLTNASGQSPFANTFGDPVVLYNRPTGTWYTVWLDGGCGSQGLGGYKSTTPLDPSPASWTHYCVHTGSNDDRESGWVDNNSGSPFFGRMYVSWNDFARGQGIFVRFSTDNGATWTNERQVTTNFIRNVQITGDMGGTGAVYIAGMDEMGGGLTNRANRMYRSTDGGNTWAPPYIGPTFPAPGRTASGFFATMYSSPAYWRHQGWGQPAALNGVVHYVYDARDPGVDPANVFYIRSTDSGVTFSAPFMLNTNTDGTKAQWQPNLSVTSGGSLLAVWYDERERVAASCQPSTPGTPCYRMWARRSTDNGATWLPDETFSDVVTPLPLQPDPSIVATYAGDYDYGSPVLNQHLRSWTDGRVAINNNPQQNAFFDREPISAGLSVISSVPACSSVVFTLPVDFTFDVTDPVNPATLQASDLTVNGIPADSVAYTAGTTTMSFHFNITPVSAQGLQTIHIPAGAFTRASDGNPVFDFACTFRYDAVPLQVASTNPPFPGGAFNLPGPFTYDVNFSEPIDPSSAQTSDLTLSGVSGAAVSAVVVQPGNTTARFTINMTAPGTLTASIAGGAFTDPFGNPNAAFSAQYQVSVNGCVVQPVFTQNFDSVTPPALPAGWVATNAQGAAPLWVTSSAGVPAPAADTAPNAASIDDPAVVTDKRLDSPSIAIQSTFASLSFRHNRNLESTFDGGVLEISIGGGAFNDIITAGGTFTSGGYTGPISTAFMSPIAGRMAWSGNSSGFITTTVDLPAAAAGQNIMLRWRMASDNSVSAQGWRIDTISVSDCVATGTPSPTPTATATSTGTPSPTATATSTVASTPTPSPCGSFGENFDSVTAPALPAGWVASNAAGAAPLWVTTTTTPDTAPNDAFIDDPAVVTDKLLITPAISITSAAAQLTFRNFYFLESTFDGGVLEVSSPNINAGAFTDVTNAAVGGNFVSGGYNATISTAFMSPIAGRMAWSGNAGGYINSVANLGPNVVGQTIKLRFRMASDNSVSATGWRVDTIFVSGGPCGTPSPTPTATATSTGTPSSTPTATATASCAQTFSENFDGVVAPALPSGWVATNPDPGDGTMWETSTVTPDSAPNCLFVPDQDGISDKVVDTPGIAITSASAVLSFRNNFNTEFSDGIFWDGYVLEVSAPNISGGAFLDVTSPQIGGSFVSGGYTGEIDGTANNPLAGRMAWSADSGGYINTVVNLGSNVNGQTIKLRFRMGTDEAIAAPGVRIDSLVLTSTGCGTPTPTATATATATSGGPSATPSCAPIITHSSSQAITTGNSVSCNNGTGHTDNSYWRAFNMGTFVGGAAYNVTDVSFGVESANVTQPVTVRLYTNSGGAFPAGTRTEIATTTVSVTAAQTGTVVTAPLAATVPAGSELVMELFTPDGQAAGNLFFVGSNASPETGPSYISAAACGITTPTTTAAVGFPNMHIVFNVHGSCTGVTPSPTVTSTPTTTPTATATATGAETPTPTATPTPTPSASPSPSTPPAAQALNLSTRMRVLTEANVGIGGFIITGTAPKTVLLRAIGPSLSNFGVPDPLADPVMELHGPAGFTTITNDNWMDTQPVEIEATGLAPTNELESAILATLDPGQYTAVVKGKDNGVGVGLVEAYDLDGAAAAPAGASASRLGNISTRAFVGTNTDIMIAGFILGGGTEDDNVILRGIGPSLTQFGVPDALADPTLELRDNNGALLISNDNWQDDPGQAAIITKAGLAPSDPAESAIASTLSPGTYTALLAGKNNGTGVGLVEAYDLGAGAAVPTPTPGSPTPTATATATGGPSATATATATPGGNPCTENWDGVTAPALPPGWTATNPDPGDGTMWETSITNPDSAPNCAFIGDQDGISDKVLDWMTVTINSASAVLSFRNNFNTEFSDGIFWDGYVLEVSSPNISGGAFLDITDSHVGGSFVSGGYTGEIDGTANNPLAGRMAWSADSGGYIDTAINLGPNVAGQTVTLRFRMGTDEAVAAPGVRMDGLSISNSSCP